MSNKYLTKIYNLWYNKSERDENKAHRKPLIPVKEKLRRK